MRQKLLYAICIVAALIVAHDLVVMLTVLPDEAALPFTVNPRHMNGALALDIPHHLRYRILRWYRDQHMHMILH